MRTFFWTALLLITASFAGKQPDTKALDDLLDQWHRSAAAADLEAYFAPTTDQFIFLGTDPEERWDKAAFKAFCQPYFEQGKGWDFRPHDRHWIFSEDGKTAWFDEKLDTWMEECRGSGVMVRKGKEWKLAYYNLTVVIENDKIKSFIELRKQ